MVELKQMVYLSKEDYLAVVVIVVILGNRWVLVMGVTTLRWVDYNTGTWPTRNRCGGSCGFW